MMWKAFVWCWKVIKQYLSNCNIHGVRYLVDDQISYPERLFWLISCILCWYGCVKMITDVVMNYIEYPVAVTVESMYTDWETPFPAIVFCISTTKTLKNKYFKRPQFGNSNSDLLQTTSEELLSLYDEMRYKCPDLLAECTWNGKKFNCCSEFQELRKTGVGYCLAMNTYHLGNEKVRYFVNRTVNYGDLIIDVHLGSKPKDFVLSALTVHVLNNLKLPTLSNAEKGIQMAMGKMKRIEFSIYDTFNTPGVENVAIKHRHCRFRHEKLENSIFDIYSSDTCYLQMITERMVKFCGCVSFYYFAPKGTRVCNWTEMLCINGNMTEISSAELWDQMCLPSCEGTVLTTNRWDAHEYDAPKRSYSRFHFTLLSHPYLRHRRYVVNELLDVVVSVGSAVGLFMGASILSIFEIPYWLFIRRDKIR
ncbi:pickpocket 13 isoform X1 [Megalopta genalis]|uniref:pickpocket 13 isoform X1 n=2 Tax=Megalopta genalis TaxID=115081 RepID=UPI003FD670DB